MFSNPITSIIGAIYLLCPLLEVLVPETAGVCAKLQNNLIGIGFLSTADGIKTRVRAMFQAKDVEPSKIA